MTFDRRGFEIDLGDAEYPALLAESPDPPRRLYGLGDPAALGPGLAAIGARKATPYGLQAARLLVGWAAEAGYTIVSGGAVGCDQAAHRAALAAGAPTVAVMAGGADVAYPSGARALLASISSSGAVVSEHPWGSEPKRWAFRTRNRIIAGLCPVLLVLESGVPSGTFSTADYALDAARTVLAVPGSIFASECRGANRLIQQGAIPVTDPSFLAEALRSEIGEAPRRNSVEWSCPSTRGREEVIMRALCAEAMRPDDAAFKLGLDIVEVARSIGSLERGGLITKYRDGRYGPLATPTRATMRETSTAGGP